MDITSYLSIFSEEIDRAECNFVSGSVLRRNYLIFLCVAFAVRTIAQNRLGLFYIWMLWVGSLSLSDDTLATGGNPELYPQWHHQGAIRCMYSRYNPLSVPQGQSQFIMFHVSLENLEETPPEIQNRVPVASK